MIVSYNISVASSGSQVEKEDDGRRCNHYFVDILTTIRVNGTLQYVSLSWLRTLCTSFSDKFESELSSIIADAETKLESLVKGAGHSYKSKHVIVNYDREFGLRLEYLVWEEH